MDGLTGGADTEGATDGRKRKLRDDKEAAPKQERDVEAEPVGSLDVRPSKKSRTGSTRSNDQDRRDSAMPSWPCSRGRGSSLAGRPRIVCNSVSAEPSSSKSGFIKRTGTTGLPTVGEVIPPRPDQINKSESETYTISPMGNGRNWNPFKDTMFWDPAVKSASGRKRSVRAQEPLQAARRQMEFELEANLNQLSARPSTEADNILTSARGTAGGGAKTRSESTRPLPSKSTSMGSDPDELSSSDTSDSEASSSATTETSPLLQIDRGECEVLPHEVTKLRKENARLRMQSADALDSNAAASRREASLLRQLSWYEGAGERDGQGGEEGQDNGEVKDDDEKRSKE
ncbi:hypothetical protein A1O7_03982 [Cladophialophora yegresii CBS 114405]|uniref:Uncharacterized protein n=1 Tax=Cladophialophora yegresii CBS 114405 TaxID=1182544 RepID=W9W4C9_9EURO|nr:uncharacterized protein A1O7_03982 [Cladophialophora yegresii CBS 114405]EXJ59835.1 hypothetical protein A1O7_03982 [Cladophialophora yegresii CBS 114405]